MNRYIRDMPRLTPRERLLLNVIVAPTGCWEWGRSINKDGYGVTLVGKSMNNAHRATYLAFVGPIPDGMHIDHLCRNRKCVNPAHLECVTPMENVRRAIEANGGTPQSLRTHCKNGHPYTPENTGYVTRSSGERAGKRERSCRICMRTGVKKYKSKLQEAAP